MGRHYHVDIAAFAADADLKWVDNLLSHFEVPGVESARQGVARRLSLDALRTIVLVRALTRDLGLSADRALEAAVRLLGDGHAPAGAWTEVHLDADAFHREVDRRIADAVEAVVPRRRGRPPGSAGAAATGRRV
jgi:hypothetical protein